MMGGGMMGGTPAPSAKPLPDADSAGAKLVSSYCVQCHAAPQPTLHTAKEWTSVTQRMHIHMDSGLQGIKSPTEQGDENNRRLHAAARTVVVLVLVK